MANQYSNGNEHGDSCSHCGTHKHAYSADVPIGRQKQKPAARTASMAFATGLEYSLPPTPSAPSSLVSAADDQGYFSSDGLFHRTYSHSSLDSWTLPLNATTLDDMDFFPSFDEYISTDALRTPAGTKAAEHNAAADDDLDDIFGDTSAPVAQWSSSWSAPDQAAFSMQVDTTKIPAASALHAVSTTGNPARNCFEKVLSTALALDDLDDSCTTLRTEQACRVPQNADQVLFRNREAVRVVRESLSCPCASDQDIVVACCLALTKVLSWYDAVIGEPEENNASPHQTRGPCDRVVATPIFMGTYRLDPRAQRSVLARVVLSELRDHVQPILAKLPKQCISGTATAGSSTHGPGATSSGVGSQNCALREQAKSIVAKATGLIAG